MGLFDFFKPNPLKSKILAIRKDIKNLISEICYEKFWIDWYGAYDINPRHLVFLTCVESDNMKIKLRSDLKLNEELRSILDKHEYPLDARDQVIIDFESQETVDRESRGRWHEHLR